MTKTKNLLLSLSLPLFLLNCSGKNNQAIQSQQPQIQNPTPNPSKKCLQQKRLLTEHNKTKIEAEIALLKVQKEKYNDLKKRSG